MKNYKFLISGRVQGVYYRANVAKNAKKAGFNGYVMNLEDGRVKACVSCEANALEKFKAILLKGSPISKVTGVEQSLCEEQFTTAFKVRK